MSFLYCDPCVFVIGKEYEILVIAKENGIISLVLGGETYYEDNTGVLSSEKCFAKIRVPKEKLDASKEYTVSYRKTVKREGYFSKLEEERRSAFAFKPLTKKDGINLYHVSDVHYHFDLAKKTATYFGDDLDVLLVNGDIGEVETIQNYLEVAEFVGDITKGALPVVFVRGNHDTRGRLAELYTEYFPSNGKKTYFTFDLGPICGVAFDCGEDKDDSHAEYGGVNAFATFRRKESEFFQSLESSDKPTFAIGHMCPAQITDRPGSEFDIEADLYSEWVGELERIGISFMICGHFHRTYVLESDDDRSLIPHNFPVIIGTGCDFAKDDMWGTAITIEGGKANIKFTDSHHNVRESHVIDIK